MEIIIALIGIITAVELYRFWLSVRPTTKKRHFKGKLVGTKQMRWDLEFKKAKTAQIREDIRKEYDYMKSRKASIEQSIKEFKGPKGDKARLQDDLERADRDIERLQNQIAALDVQIHGSKKTNQYPDGYDGFAQQIESFKELEGMLKGYIKNQ